MRSAAACFRTSGACVSNQYFWNASRERLGSRRRQKLSFTMGRSVSRSADRLLLGHERFEALLVQRLCVGVLGVDLPGLDQIEERVVHELHAVGLALLD